MVEVEIPVEAILYPDDEDFWSNVSKRKDIEAGDVFIISKTIRIERHPVATTASVLIDGIRYEATSKCHPNDQFSKRLGRAVALDKLIYQLCSIGFEVSLLSEYNVDVDLSKRKVN